MREKFRPIHKASVKIPTGEGLRDGEVFDSVADAKRIYGYRDKATSDSEFVEIESQNPKVEYTNSGTSVDGKEYTNFLFSITEEILKSNDLTPGNVQNVINSHIAANMGKLDLEKMLTLTEDFKHDLQIIEHTVSNNKRNSLLKHRLTQTPDLDSRYGRESKSNNIQTVVDGTTKILLDKTKVRPRYSTNALINVEKSVDAPLYTSQDQDRRKSSLDSRATNLGTLMDVARLQNQNPYEIPNDVNQNYRQSLVGLGGISSLLTKRSYPPTDRVNRNSQDTYNQDEQSYEHAWTSPHLSIKRSSLQEDSQGVPSNKTDNVHSKSPTRVSSIGTLSNRSKRLTSLLFNKVIAESTSVGSVDLRRESSTSTRPGMDITTKGTGSSLSEDSSIDGKKKLPANTPNSRRQKNLEKIVLRTETAEETESMPEEFRKVSEDITLRQEVEKFPEEKLYKIKDIKEFRKKTEADIKTDIKKDFLVQHNNVVKDAKTTNLLDSLNTRKLN